MDTNAQKTKSKFLSPFSLSVEFEIKCSQNKTQSKTNNLTIGKPESTLKK